MEYIIKKQGIIVIARVKDLPRIFKGIPAHITLQEFIRSNLH